MKEIKQKGAPTNKTPGAVGDIYVDLETGVEYKCTFAYQGPFLDELECVWRPTGKTIAVKLEPKKPAEKPIEVESVEEVKEPVKSEKPKYVNYSDYSKKKHK